MHGCDGVVLAAGLGWLEGLIPFLFVLIWIVSNVLGAIRKAGKPAGPRPAGRPPQPRAARPPELDREIEEIMRRTLRGESTPPPPPPPPVKRQAKPQRQQKAKRVLAGSQGSRRGIRDSSSGDVATHVQDAFAHDLAHESPSGTARLVATLGNASASPPIDLIAALRSPEDLRRLVIVREILDVPAHRW